MTDFRNVFETAQATFREHPETARVRLEAHSQQIAGLRSEVELRRFELTVDETYATGGTGMGPSALELILAGLAAGVEATYRLYADTLGIQLEGVSAKALGDLDLSSLFGVEGAGRPGFRGISLEVELESDAPEEDLERLRAVVERHSPVLDILRNGVRTTLSQHRDEVTPALEAAH